MSAQHRVPVILTRARAQAERFAASLPIGTHAIIAPLLEISFLPLSDALKTEETLLFTSENGVTALVAQHGVRPGLRSLCVGDRTAHAARAAGLDARSAEGTADDLVRLALTTSGPFVHVRGEYTRGDIAARLRTAGKPCRELVLYAQEARPLTPDAKKTLADEVPSLVPLFSPRTAKLFYQACPTAPGAHLLCLSAAVAKEVEMGQYAACETATRPNATALQDLLSQHLQAIRLETKGASG